MTNPLFTEYVTNTAFSLVLGKTHISALVRLDLELAIESRLQTNHLSNREHARLHQHSITGHEGLTRRGLVRHVFEENKHKWIATQKDVDSGRTRHHVGGVMHDVMPYGECWNITPAGRLVCELLKECGLYQEYAGPLMPLVEETKRQRKLKKAA